MVIDSLNHYIILDGKDEICYGGDLKVTSGMSTL